MDAYKVNVDIAPTLYDTPFLSNVAFPASTLGDMTTKSKEKLGDVLTLSSPESVDAMFDNKNLVKRKVQTVSATKKKGAPSGKR